jgi:predicted transporter
MNIALFHPCPICIGATILLYGLYKIKKKKNDKI